MSGTGDDQKEERTDKEEEERTHKEEEERTHKEEEENRNNDDAEESGKEDLDPKPVVVVKKNTDYKLGKLRTALEKHQQQQLSSESDNVVLDATPLNSYSPADFDLTQLEPTLKKVRLWVADNYFKAPTTPALTPVKIPTRIRSKIVRPKPKLYLNPPWVTFLRGGPDPKPATTSDDMGPPPEPRTVKTPYETVKDALTFLKFDLGIAEEEDYEEMLEIKNGAEYSLSRVTPNSLFSMEEVVMELDLFLNSMPETTSSDVMKEMLLEFQTRLGLPPDPHFYNLMWTSPAHFMNYLVQVHQNANIDDSGAVDVNDVGTTNEDPITDGNNDGGTVDHTRHIPVVARAPYAHLPPPLLPFYDAIEILHGFVNRMENDEEFVLDETAFLNLQSDLLLPGWFRLYDLYTSKSMAEVVQFIHDYFQTSRMSRFADSKP